MLLFAALGKAEPLISTVALWPLTLTPTFDLDLKASLQWCKTRFLVIWPWPLTYDLDIHSQNSKGQGRPSCQKSRSKVKRFSQESAHRPTVLSTLSPSLAVDKNPSHYWPGIAFVLPPARLEPKRLRFSTKNLVPHGGSRYQTVV